MRTICWLSLLLVASASRGGEKAPDAPSDWTLTAPKEFYAAVYYHDFRRDFRRALPLLEKVLETASGDLRAQALDRAMHAYWITGEYERARRFYRELSKDFVGHHASKKAAHWNRAILLSLPKDEGFGISFGNVPDHAFSFVCSDEEFQLRTVHEVTFKPLPGPWTIRKLSFTLGVRRVTPTACWSTSRYASQLKEEWKGKRPRFAEWGERPSVLMRLEICTTRSDVEQKAETVVFSEDLRFPVSRKREAWKATLALPTVSVEHDLKLRFTVVELPKDLDVGMLYTGAESLGMLGMGRRRVVVGGTAERSGDERLFVDYGYGGEGVPLIEVECERFADADTRPKKLEMKLEQADPPAALRVRVGREEEKEWEL